MLSIINYAKKETRDFKDLPFNDIDSLILSTLSYIDYDGVVPCFKSHQKGIYLDSIKDITKRVKNLADGKLYINLFNNLRSNPRFQKLKLNNYIDKIDPSNESHFSAVTFNNNYFTYIAFQGTGATLLDWKEDFNMVYMYPVPAQKGALNYLNEVMSYTPGIFYIGGHSKGGNLAIYSSVKTYIWFKLRIKKVYTHDGPGFTKKMFNSLKYQLMKKKISKTVPSSSIVGMLLYSRENYKVVKSNSFGILQHSSFTWQIKGTDFVFLKDRAWDSKYFDRTISDWVDSLSNEDKSLYINTVYNILNSVDYAKIDITKNNWWNFYWTLKKGQSKLDPETKTKITEILKKLTYYERINLLSKKD